MPRKGPAPRRDLLPDPIYRSVLVTQIVNKVLERASAAWPSVSSTRPSTSSRSAATAIPSACVKRAVENTKPQLEVKSRRVGGATYQVPVEVRPRRADTLSIRWLVGYSKQRREKTMAQKLAAELLDASNGVGAAVKRREDMHKMAESNKAFAHYRW